MFSWQDIETLYRLMTGRPAEEATLREYMAMVRLAKRYGIQPPRNALTEPGEGK